MVLPESLETLRSGNYGMISVEVRDAISEEPLNELIPHLLDELQFDHPDAQLTEIDRESAAATIAYVLGHSLAYGGPTSAFDIADGCADDFVALFPQDARFYTNSAEPIYRIQFQSRDPLTISTFDAGVFAISKSRYGIIWRAEED